MEKDNNLGGISFENFENNLKKANENQIKGISSNILVKADDSIMPFGTSKKWKDGRWYKKVYGGWIPDVEKNKKEQELREKIVRAKEEEKKVEEEPINEESVIIEEPEGAEEPNVEGIERAIDAIKQARIDGLIAGVVGIFAENDSIEELTEKLKLFGEAYTKIKNS